MKRKSRGNLIEYVLPIATAGVIFGLGIMGFARAGVMGNFWATSVDGTMDQSNKLIALGKKSTLNAQWGKTNGLKLDFEPGTPPSNDIPPVSLGGTPTNPVSVCQNGSCLIDFGDFVLDGIPENFNQVVESTGAAGGSDTLMNVLIQLANVMEDQGLLQEANMIKDLANLGHNIARIEESLENGVVGCNGDSSCVWDMLNNTTMNVPSGFNNQVGYFPPGITYQQAKESITVGGARAILNGLETYTGSIPMADNPSFQYATKFDEVMGNNNISSTVKDLVKQLTWTLGQMSEDFDDNVWASTHPEFYGTTQTGYIRDTLTGEKSYPVMDFTNVTVYDSFNNYNASNISDITSALQCSVGGGIDPGTSCN